VIGFAGLASDLGSEPQPAPQGRADVATIGFAYREVVESAKPPPIVQALIFGPLAALDAGGRLRR
jgi:hypothetical protein